MLGLAFLAVGCGSGVSAAPPVPVVSDASRVDMCTILIDAELTELGIELSSRKPVNHLGLVGCKLQGMRITLDLERDNDTLAQYQARRHGPAFTSFEDNTVNG
jgi:hypothetical protein